jgi:hypothetical protein
MAPVKLLTVGSLATSASLAKNREGDDRTHVTTGKPDAYSTSISVTWGA